MTETANFPVFNPGGDAYFQRTNAGYFNGFILKFETPLVGIKEEKVKETKPFKVIIPSFFNKEIPLQILSGSETPMTISLYNILGQKVFTRDYSEGQIGYHCG